MRTMSLERASLDEIFRQARAADPDECCGAVVVRDGRDEVWAFENVQNELHARDPERYPRTARTAYTLGPKDAERLESATTGNAEIGELKVIYHSHSKNGAYFSGEDRAQAMFGPDPMYPDVAYVVVSDAREEGEARAYRWDEAEHDFVELSIELA